MSATMTGTPGVAAPEATRSVGDATVHRWSARRMIAFVVLSCGAFWIAVAAFVSALIQGF